MKYPLSFLSFFILLVSNVSAETVVRLELQVDATISNIDIKLFETATPLTTASFLEFVDAVPVPNAANTPTESFDNTFIHQMNTGNFVKGGKFSYTPPGDFTCEDSVTALGCDSDGTALLSNGLQFVTTDILATSIPPEFSKSNVRGTITMEQVVPENFSRSIWFINTSDNLNLDVVSGPSGAFVPYTAFGEIINGTMTSVDSIEPAVVTVNQNSIHIQMNPIPLINYTLADPVLQANLVRINTAKRLFSITSDVLPSLTADLDYVFVLTNANHDSTVTVTNLGVNTLTVNAIATTDLLALPFSIFNDNCTAIPLITSATCTFKVRFNSSVEGSFSDAFNIEFDIGDGIGIEKQSVSYGFTVQGAAAIDLSQNISITNEGETVNEFDFSAIAIGTGRLLSALVTNEGNAGLIISSIEVTGDDASSFQLTEDCTILSSVIEGETCAIDLIFSATEEGEKLASLTIQSNDPDQSEIILPIIAFGDTDSDGVRSDIENDAPNSGDNNADGIEDSIQSNVASFIGDAGKYITLVVDASLAVTNIVVEDDKQFPELPDNVDFTHGVLTYEIFLPRVGGTIQVGVVLPKGKSPKSYYLYSTTDDDDTLHWFPIDDLEFTSIDILDDSIISLDNGDTVERNLIVLSLQDGGPGDADESLNGRIVLGPGAPAYSSKKKSSSGGSFDLWMLFVLMLSINRCRKL